MTEAQWECLRTLILEWPMNFWNTLAKWPDNSLWMDADGTIHLDELPTTWNPLEVQDD